MTKEKEQWTLKELAVAGEIEFGDGYRTKRSELGDSGFPILRVAEVLDGKIAPVYSEFVRPEFRSSMKHKVARPGDIVLTTKGTVGRVAVIPPQSAEFSYSPQVCYFRTTGGNKVISRYLYYWLRSDEFRVQAGRLKGQTDMADYLNLADIGSLRVALPDLQTQRNIVEVLGALDDKIASNEQIGETALALAEALYVRDSAHENGWHEVALADTAKWMSGGTPKTSEPSYWHGDIPWISASSLKSPWLDDSERRVTQWGADNGTRLVPAETIIFVVRGMSLTSEFRVGLTQREVAFGQDCKALIPRPGIDPVVLLLALRSRTPEILGLVDTAGHGTGRLGTDRIEKLRVRLPSGEAGAAFTETVRYLAQHASAVQRENRTLVELRNTLLPQLVTGKIRIKDAVCVVEDVAS
ncbi:restriction endonuclease subunit S [Streptomyces anulatus]|uniref:restriction endonuclease subunit S n=1 Tax=Streptomyces TaxID=1883 RepID=UPI000F890F09|nr:restriction endonuclease subunit S [Streptomyces sp. NP10]RUP68572.1 Type I restriction modification DNA specificity domain protein [Streptomyces sp. NP10]